MLNKITEYRDLLKYNELVDIHNFYYGENISNYLINYTKESDDKYKWRKNVSYYKNYVKPIVNGLTNFLFIKNHTIEVNEPYIHNIDLNNNTLLIFMQKITKNAIRDGLTFIIADTNKIDDDISIIDEKNKNIRGYLKNYEYMQLVNWKYKNNNLSQIVFKELVEIDKDEYQVELVEQYTKYYIGGGEIYQKIKNNLELVYKWENNLNYIPISMFYGTLDYDNLNAKSIIREVVELNKAHYNLNSSLMNISHIASNPTPVTYGIPQNNINDMKLGVNTVLIYPTAQGGAYKFEWVEPNGKAVEIAERELKALEDYIINTSYNILKVEKYTTATEAKIKNNENKSILNLIANNLENSINKSLNYLKDLTKQNIGEIKINKDFDNIAINWEEIKTLIDLKDKGFISLETLLNTLKEGEILNIDNIDDEVNKIKNEINLGLI